MLVTEDTAEILQPDLSRWSGEPPEIRLSPIDSVMPACYINALYVFGNTEGVADFMPFHLLRAGLAAALASFPDLCYQLRRCPTTGDCTLVPTNVGCRLVTATADFTIADLEAVDFDPTRLPDGLLDGSAADCGQFCARVKLTRLADGSAAVGAFLHHSVTDGDGAFTFVNRWAAACKELRLGRDPPLGEVARDRSALFSDCGAHGWDHLEYVYQEPAGDAVAAAAAPTDAGAPAAPEQTAPAFTARVFHLGVEFLRHLKESVNSGAAAVCSTNDCLVALLWRCIARAKRLPDGETSMLGMACNARSRLGLPAAYAGNANFYIARRLTVAEVAGSSLPELARQIRAAVDQGTQPEYLRSILRWLDSKADKSRIQPGFRMFSSDLAVTSWVHFPIYDADFGWGRPFRFAIPSKGFDGLVVLLPRWDGDGCDVMLGSRTDVVERLASMPEFLEPF